MTDTVTGPSLEILKRQRDRDRLELEGLRAECVALKHQLGHKANPILVEVTRALLLGALASDPLQGIQVNGDRVMRTNPTYPDPGASTRAAREQLRILHRNLLSAVERFDRAAEHGWYPPRPPKEPQVRCRNTSCEQEGRRLPKYIGVGTSRIEMFVCQSCHGQLT